MNQSIPGDLQDFLKADAFFKIDSKSIFSKLFRRNAAVWTALDCLPSLLRDYFENLDQSDALPFGCHVHRWLNRENQNETVVSIEKGVYAKENMCFKQIQLAIGKGSCIEPGVVIKPPLIIGQKSEIRQGAYIRGGAIIGDHCTVGHTTEVKTAIFMDYTEAGHFAYVGDSLLGRCVNLGAGTKLANLPFRTLKMKENQEFPNFDLKIHDVKLPLFRAKLGAIVGDGVEIGCNSTLAPASLIGPDSWIYPCVFVRGGFYPARSIVTTSALNTVKRKK